MINIASIRAEWKVDCSSRDCAGRVICKEGICRLSIGCTPDLMVVVVA